MKRGLKFEIKHTFDCDLRSLEDALLGVELLQFLAHTMNSILSIRPVEIRTDGDVIRRRVEYHPEPQISRIGAWRVPDQWHAWVEESTYDRKTRTLYYRNIPLTGRLQNVLLNEGTITFHEENGRVVRTLRGQLEVKARWLGGLAEKVIYRQAMRLLDEEALATQQFLRMATAHP